MSSRGRTTVAALVGIGVAAAGCAAWHHGAPPKSETAGHRPIPVDYAEKSSSSPAAPNRPQNQVARAAPSASREGRLNPDWRIGEKRKLGIGSFRQLVAEHAGWSIWWTRQGSWYPRCFARKYAFESSSSRTPPWVELMIILSSGWRMTHVNVQGPGGSHRKGSEIEIDGKYYLYLSEKDIPDLEGKIADFRVTMGVWEHLYVDTRTTRGRVNLTGLSRAYHLVKECAARPADP